VPYGTMPALGSHACVALSSDTAEPLCHDLPVAVKR